MKRPIIFLLAALLTACGAGDKRKEIEQRREALHQKQIVSLEEAQQRLATVDSLLQAVTLRHDAQHAYVMEHATQLNDQSPEVVELNRLRSRRDSLQAEWNTLGAKIKYIRRRQQELAGQPYVTNDDELPR